MKHLKTILVLTIVVVTSMMSVFFVEGITSPIVEARINEQINRALLEFFPEADEQPTYEVTSLFDTNSLIRNVYKLQENGQDIGLFYRARFPGWIAPIEILIGIDVRTNEVVNVSVLEQGETPGIGEALLASPAFLAQFNRVQTLALQEDGVDMPAGTSAPLTLGRFNRGVRDILIYHAVNYLGEEAPIEETPEQIKLRLLNTWFPGDTFVDVNHEFTALEEFKQASSGGVYFIVRFKGSGGATGEGITRYIVGFNDNTMLGLEPLEVGETPEYGGRYLFNRNTIAQFNNRDLEEFITTGLDAYTGATVTRSAFDQSLYLALAFYQTDVLGFERATERAIDEEIYTALTAISDAPSFRNESIKLGAIYGVYTSRSTEGEPLGVFYHIVHDNGDWSPANHSLVELDPDTNAIRQLEVIRANSSYTTHWPEGVGIELGDVDVSFLVGVDTPGTIERSDFDLQAGASTNPAMHTIPALIQALNEVLAMASGTTFEVIEPTAFELVRSAASSIYPGARLFDESIRGEYVQGVYTIRNPYGDIQRILYYLVTDNGRWGQDNRTLVSIDPLTHSIAGVHVFEASSSYTTHWDADPEDKIEFGQIDFSVLVGRTLADELSRELLDLGAGATENPGRFTLVQFFEALLEALETHQSATYRTMNLSILDTIEDTLVERFGSLTFVDEKVYEGPIQGVVTTRSGNRIDTVIYYVTSRNGRWGSDNHTLIQINPVSQTIVDLWVFESTSSYTTHWDAPREDKLELDRLDLSFMIGQSIGSSLDPSAIDFGAGATANPARFTLPSFIEALEAAFTYQVTTGLGGQ